MIRALVATFLLWLLPAAKILWDKNQMGEPNPFVSALSNTESLVILIVILGLGVLVGVGVSKAVSLARKEAIIVAWIISTIYMVAFHMWAFAENAGGWTAPLAFNVILGTLLMILMPVMVLPAAVAAAGIIGAVYLMRKLN